MTSAICRCTSAGTGILGKADGWQTDPGVRVGIVLAETINYLAK